MPLFASPCLHYRVSHIRVDVDDERLTLESLLSDELNTQSASIYDQPIYAEWTLLPELFGRVAFSYIRGTW